MLRFREEARFDVAIIFDNVVSESVTLEPNPFIIFNELELILADLREGVREVLDDLDSEGVGNEEGTGGRREDSSFDFGGIVSC